jgi:NAD(P)-dependent dehydrogenase (short-subunit alcohol dehydrogenase family)
MGQDLKGQIAVITGGGSGIGRGLALALAGLGAKTVICGRRRERLEETLAEIKAAGGEGLLVQADISEIKEARGVIQAALDAYGRIDILINKPASTAATSCTDGPRQDRVMRVNRGPLLMARRARRRASRQRADTPSAPNRGSNITTATEPTVSPSTP